MDSLLLARIAVAVLVAVFSAWCGAEINASGELIAPLVGTSPRMAMAASALLVASYTWTGGFRSVVVTDVAAGGLAFAIALAASGRPAPAHISSG